MARRFIFKAVMGGLGAALCAVLVAACTGPTTTASSGSTSSTSADSTLNVLLYQNPVGEFSPLAPSSGPDNQVMSLIYEGLLGVSNDYQLEPEIASSYTVSPDGTTFTFHIRPGLKWSDGQPLTSADVLFTYDVMANPKSGSATAANYTGVQGVSAFVAGKASTISGFSAPNPTTFVIKATSPDVGLLALIGSVDILPKHILGNVPVSQLATDPYFHAPTAASGPFKFVTFKPNQYVEVVKNPYYRDPAKIDTVFLKPMTSDGAIAALSNGELDIASFPATDLSTVEGFKGVTVDQATSGGFVRIVLNQRQPFFKNILVRQAFLYAVNRTAIVSKVLYGKGTVQNSDFFAPDDPPGMNTYPYDPAKARQLLEEAGWDFNRTLTLQWVPGDADRDAAVTIVQSELGAIGVKVSLHQETTAEAATLSPNFDMDLYGGGNYATSPWSVNAITACDAAYPTGANNQAFCDPTLDKEMAAANAISNPSARAAAYDKAILRENKDADEMWLYDPDGLWGVSDQVHGFSVPGSNTDPFWDPAAWSLS